MGKHRWMGQHRWCVNTGDFEARFECDVCGGEVGVNDGSHFNPDVLGGECPGWKKETNIAAAETAEIADALPKIREQVFNTAKYVDDLTIRVAKLENAAKRGKRGKA